MKIGIVGLGSMGKNHLRVLQNIMQVDKEIEIVGVCDPFANIKTAFKLYRNLDEFIDKEPMDALIIAVPTSLHKEVAIKALKTKINILIEKPIASNMQEALAIEEEAKKSGVKVAIGHVERFNPSVLKLKEILKEREIYSIDITRVGPLPPRIADVGVLRDLAVHDIDIIRFISGKEIIDTSIFKSQKIHNHHEDNAMISLKLQGDIVANITTNWLTPFKKRQIDIATRRSYFEANLIMQDIKEYMPYPEDLTYNSYVQKNWFIKKEEPLYNELVAFIDYLRNGSTISHLASIKDAIETINVITKEV